MCDKVAPPGNMGMERAQLHQAQNERLQTQNQASREISGIELIDSKIKLLFEQISALERLKHKLPPSVSYSDVRALSGLLDGRLI